MRETQTQKCQRVSRYKWEDCLDTQFIKRFPVSYWLRLKRSIASHDCILLVVKMQFNQLEISVANARINIGVHARARAR